MDLNLPSQPPPYEYRMSGSYTSSINPQFGVAEVAIDDQRFSDLRVQVAAHEEKINGLAKESTLVQMFAAMRADMAKEFSALRAEISPMKEDIAAMKSELNHKPSTESIYRLVAAALILGLGGVFTVFKYLIPPIH